MNQFSISQLEKFSGIKAHTIRIWEQRYNALQPNRSEGNTRYYDNEQLRRLLNIVSLSNQHYKVLELCGMPDQQLFKLVWELENEIENKPEEYFISQLILAGVSYDDSYFDKIFSHTLLRYGMKKTYLKVIYPVLVRTGLMWACNDLAPANEHFISNLFRQKLFTAIDGSELQLNRFMEEAQYKYETGMRSLTKMPGISITEFADFKLMKGALRLQIFTSFSKHVRKYFSNPKLISLMEFPVLFLGAMPQDTPALYNLMNYAALKLGTWYPIGGLGKVIEAMVRICETNGVVFHFNSPVEKISVSGNNSDGVIIDEEKIFFDAVVASADYHHVESILLPEADRNYNEDYWEKKTFAPSCLIFYLGISKKIRSLQHHTLFFEHDLLQHSIEIYKDPKWPSKPLFYACCPSKSDDTVAPEGHENLFLLMPIAPDLEDSELLREKYFKIMIERLEKHTGQSIGEFIDYKKSYCIKDFMIDYNSYKGNAYGLANTLMQTAILKPKIINKKIKNLFYTGQLTVPGPGVPPSLISGKIVAQQLLKILKPIKHEVLI